MLRVHCADHYCLIIVPLCIPIYLRVCALLALVWRLEANLFGTQTIVLLRFESGLAQDSPGLCLELLQATMVHITNQ